MWPRLRLDIGWRDLAAGAAGLALARDAERAARRAEAALAPDGEALVCLSARSGLDLLLAALAPPAGTEVLVSALTIPDVARIVRAHGLVAVPVDVDPGTLAVSPGALAAAATERTALVIVAHLFGGLAPLEDVAELCRARGWTLVEDAAQAWVGDGWTGHPGAAATLFSFGLIKTATALGGGAVVVRDAALAARMREVQAAWPAQPRTAFAARLARGCGLKLLGARPVFTLLARLLGERLEARLHAASRGFRGDLVASIRRRPPAPLLALLARRLGQEHGVRLERRRAVGERLAAALPARSQPGNAAGRRTHWVLPAAVEDRCAFAARLRAAGFDCASRATLDCLEAPPGRAGAARAAALAARLVYVPTYAALEGAPADRLVRLLERWGGSGQGA